MNRTAAFFITIIGLPALLLFAGAQPEARVIPYYVLIFFFWGLWLVPVAVIVLVVQVFRKWGEPNRGPVTNIAGGYLTVILALALYLGVWGGQQGSSRYEQVSGISPYQLEASVMAGSSSVSLGIREFEAPGVTEGTIVTAPASEIAAVNESKRVGQSYVLRLIAASPELTWTIEPGAGVELIGDRTIPPGTYRDFTITTNAGTATMRSAGTGRCPLERDPNDCRK